MSDTTATTLKVLASGDVDGRFGAFLKRLETVEKKAGPFEMVLCVGREAMILKKNLARKITRVFDYLHSDFAQ